MDFVRDFFEILRTYFEFIEENLEYVTIAFLIGLLLVAYAYIIWLVFFKGAADSARLSIMRWLDPRGHVHKTRENGKIKIVFRYAATYHWLKWILLGLGLVWLMRFPISGWVVFAVFIWLLVGASPYWLTTLEIEQNMQNHSVKKSGSKYSFSNPLTYEWSDSSQSESD